MYRFLLTPRWWAINVFVALSVPVCLFMGSWQLSRFEARVDSHQEQKEHAEHVDEEPATPLGDLLPVTKETSGRLATVTGRFDTGHQLLVPDRRLDGRDGFYVLNLLRTEDGPGGDDRPGTDGGAAVPVVRGWLPGDADSRTDAAKVPAPPGGEVTVTGALQASEHQGSQGARPGGGLPAGQLGVISAASLVNLVPYEVHDAWITASSASGGLTPVPPTAAEGTGLDLKAFQNLGYTGEWFVFSGFVIFMWFRLFRREAEVARDLALGIMPESPSGSDPGPSGASPGPSESDQGPSESDPGPSESDQGPSESESDQDPSGSDQAPSQTDPGPAGTDQGPSGSGSDPSGAGPGPEPGPEDRRSQEPRGERPGLTPEQGPDDPDGAGRTRSPAGAA